MSHLIDKTESLPFSVEEARRILIKPNIGYPDVRRHKGRLIALSEPCITRAVLKLIRDINQKVDIVVSDGPQRGIASLSRQLGYDRICRDFEARIVDCNFPPFVQVHVPGKPLILEKYLLNREVAETDIAISIAKMKVHLFAGISLTMKNLFGLAPDTLYGEAKYGRTYLHYPFRLPRCVVDLAAIFKPSLCIIDGIIGEETQEWNGTAVESNLLIVGSNTVATDAVGTLAMGFNPEKEFPEMPFLYDINHMRLGMKAGLGTCEPSNIMITGLDIKEAEVRYDKIYACDQPPELHRETRTYIAHQASYYRQILPELLSYRGQYVTIEEGEVKDISPNLTYYDRLFKKYLTCRSRERTQEFLRIPFVKKIEPSDQDPEIIEAFRT